MEWHFINSLHEFRSLFIPNRELFAHQLFQWLPNIFCFDKSNRRAQRPFPLMTNKSNSFLFLVFIFKHFVKRADVYVIEHQHQIHSMGTHSKLVHLSTFTHRHSVVLFVSFVFDTFSMRIVNFISMLEMDWIQYPFIYNQISIPIFTRIFYKSYIVKMTDFVTFDIVPSLKCGTFCGVVSNRFISF